MGLIVLATGTTRCTNFWFKMQAWNDSLAKVELGRLAAFVGSAGGDVIPANADHFWARW